MVHLFRTASPRLKRFLRFIQSRRIPLATSRLIRKSNILKPRVPKSILNTQRRISKIAEAEIPDIVYYMADYISTKIKKPIIVFPGPITGTRELPNAIYLSVRLPVNMNEIVHELGHILTKEYMPVRLPPGVALTIGAAVRGGLLSQAAAGSRIAKTIAPFIFPAAALTEAFLGMPYLIAEYKAQQAARELSSEATHPLFHTLKQIFPVRMFFR